MRLGTMMAQRGLSASQPWMRADTHVGPELNAPLQRPDTLMQLSRSSLSKIRLVQRGRTIHVAPLRPVKPALTAPLTWGDRKLRVRGQNDANDPMRTLNINVRSGN